MDSVKDKEIMQKIFANYEDGKVSIKFTPEEIDDLIECLTFLQGISVHLISASEEIGDNETNRALTRAKMCQRLHEKVVQALQVGEPDPDYIA
jgi:hypothetical protein